MTALRRTSLIQGPAGPPTNSGSASWTPGAVSSGAFVSTTVTVTGQVVGVPVWASFSLVLPDGVILWVQTTATSTVKVYLFNNSGSPQTIGAGTLLVEGLKS